ncbi:O-antigen ligase family protein [Nitrobacteraceae bacterium UC4446_H13]
MAANKRFIAMPVFSASDRRRFALPVSVVLFLFSGFYKGIIWSPIDLTVLTCIATIAAMLPYWKQGLAITRQPAAWVLAVLVAYLAACTMPLPNPWGLRKLGELVLFGGPALLAGFIVASSARRASAFIDLLSYLSIPVTAIITVTAALGDPYSFSGVGSAGYQIVGALLSMILTACAVSKQWVFLSGALFSMYLVGNISSAVFAPLAVLYVAVKQGTVLPFIRAVCLSLVFAIVYGVAVSPPLIAMRGLWTIGGIEAKLRETYATKSLVIQQKTINGQQVAIAKTMESAPLTEFVLDAMPESMRTANEIQSQAASRFDIFADAWKKFQQFPLIGNGYGRLTYAGHPYPHNIILEMLAEGGIIAGVLLLAFIGVSVVPRPSTFATALLFITLTRAMFSGYFGSRLILFTFGLVIGSGVATAQLGNQTQERLSPR